MLTAEQKQEAQGMIDNIERKQEQRRRACPQCLLDFILAEIAKAEAEEAELLAEIRN